MNKTIKRALLFLLCGLMVIGLCACDQAPASTDDTTDAYEDTTNNTEFEPDPDPDPDPEPDPDPDPEPEPDPEPDPTPTPTLKPDDVGEIFDWNDPSAIPEGETKMVLEHVNGFGEANTVYECNDSSMVLTYKSKAVSDYNSVCEFYVQKGYTVYNSNDKAGNLATTLVSGDAMVHTYWHPSSGELNVVLSGTAGATLPPTTPAVTDGDYECSVVQLKDTTATIGMTYIVQLKDGSYIIYDGSHVDKTSAIKNYITENYKGEGLPTVRAWLLTHSHVDHTTTFSKFCKASASSPIAKVEYVIVSPLNDANYTLNDEQGYLSRAFYDDVANLSGAKVVFAHTGMDFKFCNLNMEILFAPESYYKTRTDLGNFNNTSIVSRLYGDNYSALFLGDAMKEVAAWLGDHYGNYLESNICQMAHHGGESVSDTFYDFVKPQILYYPCHRENLYDKTTLNKELRDAMEKKSYVKEILIQSLGQYVRKWGTTFADDAPLSMPDYN